MTKISSKSAYSLKNPVVSDYFVGTDSANNFNTVSFDFESTADLINKLNGNSVVKYIFSTEANIQTQVLFSGNFLSQGAETATAAISKLYFNNDNHTEDNLLSLFSFIKNNTTLFLLKLIDKSDLTKYVFYSISSLETFEKYSSINVSPYIANSEFTTLSNNSLYYFEFVTRGINGKDSIQLLSNNGTSGTATLIDGVLNIPQYSGATNLLYTPSVSYGVVSSNTGDDATVPLADATNAGLFSAAEKTKLAGITGTNTGDETTATIKTKLGITTLSGANTGDQDLSGKVDKATGKGLISDSEISRLAGISNYDNSSNITALLGKQPLDTVLTNTTAAFTTAQETKLAGIASGATTNSLDATLLARANHTGTQLASTISDIQTAITNNTAVLANTAKTSFDSTSSTRLANTSGTNTGDQDLSGLVVKNTAITGATKTKITYDSKGLVTSGDNATTDDIGEGVTNLYWSNSKTISSVLNGISISGTSIISTDTILQALGKAQNQINALAGGVTYQGVWNASTNDPALTSSLGTKGYYYVVSVVGSTNLNGITDWKLGDWAIYNGTSWQKVDNTDAVISVNGYTGIVSLTTADVPDSINKRYVTDANLVTIANQSGTNTGDNATNSQYSGLAASKQDNIILTTTGTSGASTLDGATLNIPQYSGATNLTTSQTSTNFTINSSTGDDASVPLGNGTLAGATLNDYTSAEKTKLAGIATEATANSSDATLLARANHTGTQTASTISDIQSTITNNTSVLANTAKISFDSTSSTRLANTSGTNTGDDATNSQYSGLATSKVTANTAITGATNTKITYDSKGLVTAGVNATTDDIGEGITNLYWSNSKTISSVLNGISISGTSIISTDTILQALGKAQNQINSLAGGVTYQGVWNASINDPVLTSSVGTKGYYYVVSVAGSTNLNDITDWKLGDWAIYNGTLWQKVDNTDAVISVNGYTGIVTITTADIPDSTNKRYVTDANLTVINNTSNTNTGDQGLQSVTDINAVTNKTITAVGFKTSTGTGANIFLDDGNTIAVSTIEGAVTAGTSLQYYRGDKTFQTLNTTAVVEDTNLYYTQARFDNAFSAKSTTNLTEGTNLYYLNSRARTALSFVAGSGAYDNATGLITIPTNNTQIINGSNYITLGSLSSSATGLTYTNTTGEFSFTSGYSIPTNTSQTSWNTAYTSRIATFSVTGSSGAATFTGNTLNIPTYTISGLAGAGLQLANTFVNYNTFTYNDSEFSALYINNSEGGGGLNIGAGQGISANISYGTEGTSIGIKLYGNSTENGVPLEVHDGGGLKAKISSSGVITGSQLKVSGGFTTGFLKANGDIDSTTYSPSPATITSSSGNIISGSTHTHAITASLGFIGNGSGQYQVPVTGATPFTPTWTSSANIYGSSGLNSLSFQGSSGFIRMTGSNTFIIDGTTYVTGGGTATGTNTGDETAARIGTLINGSGNATPNDTDYVATSDATTPLLKKITWTNVKLFLKTYFDTLYSDKAYNIYISTGTSISTITTGTYNGSGAYTQNGRNVMIQNTTNAINITCDSGGTSDFIASYTKLGNATITFQPTSGASNITAFGGLFTLSGQAGSTALLTRNGTGVYYLQINNL